MVVSAVFLLMGLWVLWQATMLPTFSVFGPGPEFMPNLAGVLLVLLSLLLFFNSWRSNASLPEGFMPDRGGIFRVLIILASLGLYTALLDLVGYLPMTFAYALFMLLAMWKARWYVSVVVATLITGGFYWVFVVLLEVPAPRGIFGI